MAQYSWKGLSQDNWQCRMPIPTVVWESWLHLMSFPSTLYPVHYFPSFFLIPSLWFPIYHLGCLQDPEEAVGIAGQAPLCSLCLGGSYWTSPGPGADYLGRQLDIVLGWLGFEPPLRWGEGTGQCQCQDGLLSWQWENRIQRPARADVVFSESTDGLPMECWHRWSVDWVLVTILLCHSFLLLAATCDYRTHSMVSCGLSPPAQFWVWVFQSLHWFWEHG